VGLLTADIDRLERDASVFKRRWLLDPNLVLYLPLWHRACTGSSFGSRNPGTLHTATVTGATWGSQGRTFDGVDDRLTLPANASFYNVFASSFTLIMWVKPIAITNGKKVIFDKPFTSHVSPFYQVNMTINNDDFGGLSTDKHYGFNLWNTVVNEYLNVEAAANSAVVGRWSHLAAVFNSVSPSLTFYIDTVQAGQDTTPSGTYSNYATGAALGMLLNVSAYKSNEITGDVLLYNRALTLAEVTHNYLATKWRYE
jgi:hypothetical protein